MSLFGGAPNIKKMQSRRDIDGLIGALTYPKSRQVCVDAALALGQLGDRRAVEPLLTVLQKREMGVYQAALTALGELRDLRAIEPLLAAIGDKSTTESRQAAEAALEKFGPSLLPALPVALKDSDWSARQIITRLLEKIGPAAITALETVLRDRDETTRRVTAEMLDKLGWKPSNDETGAFYWIAKGRYDRCQQIGPAAIPPLLMVLRDGSAPNKQVAAETLKKLGWEPGNDAYGAAYWAALGEWQRCAQLGPAALGPLVAALGVPDHREKVVAALKTIGAPEVVDRLVENLKRRDSAARKDAAWTLAQIADARAVEPLVAALKDSDPSVAYWATTALGNIGDGRALEPLIATLSHGTEDMRHTAAVALGKLRDARALESLIAALKDSSYNVRYRAAESLAQLGAPVVERLLEVLKDSNPNMRIGAARALAAIGDTRAVLPLADALSDAFVDVRLAASQGLLDFGDARAVERLTAALNDQHGDVSKRAAAALEKIRSRA